MAADRARSLLPSSALLAPTPCSANQMVNESTIRESVSNYQSNSALTTGGAEESRVYELPASAVGPLVDWFNEGSACRERLDQSLRGEPNQLAIAKSQIPSPVDDEDNHSVCNLRDGLLMREMRPNRNAGSELRPAASYNNQVASGKRSSSVNKVVGNEPLLGGFALLRAAQLLNFDVYYINRHPLNVKRKVQLKGDEGEREDDNAKRIQVEVDLEAAAMSRNRSISSVGLVPLSLGCPAGGGGCGEMVRYRTVLDDLADYNPLQKYISKSWLLGALFQLLRCCLSIFAITVAFTKSISTIILCVIARFDPNKKAPSETLPSDDTSMAIFVLILLNISSMHILYSTIFNGHLLWSLLDQRLFLVSRKFQYKTMLSLLLFIYLEYVINISFINNLFDITFGPSQINSDQLPRVGSYYTLAKLRAFATDHDDQNQWLDLALTVKQFARGIIRMSPYITINYAIICLKEHINTIRNQRLLTDSLKRRQKLRIVVTDRNLSRQQQQQQQQRKKRVIFATDQSGRPNGQLASRASSDLDASSNQENNRNLANGLAVSPISAGPDKQADLEERREFEAAGGGNDDDDGEGSRSGEERKRRKKEKLERESFLGRIGDFDELESYITNLYIFTGRLNRLMSRQGLTIFFIVHNLVISTSLIIPEAVRGGMVMAYVIRFLVVLIGIVPFIFGQSLNDQLEQLSKQIDRIIIQQQFISRRRDNLVRIRELLHDIRVNCGGMLNFNVKTGIKYLVVAFASAFFIEQEDYKLTRRH